MNRDKWCKRCWSWKPRDEFYDKRYRDRKGEIKVTKGAYCKQCWCAYIKERNCRE